jgi:hypothetical protein
LEDAVQPSSTVFKFDVYIVSTGAAFNLTSYGIKLALNSTIVNAGTISFSYVSGSTGISIPPLAVQTALSGGVTYLEVASNVGSQTVSTTPLKIGTFQISNSVAFGSSPIAMTWDFTNPFPTTVNINSTISTVPANHINGLSPYQMTLLNDVQVSSTVYEFDVEIVRTSVDFNLTSYQVCLTYNTLIANGGTLTFSYIPGSTTLTSCTPIAAQIVSDGVSNLIFGSTAGSQLVTTTPLIVGRFRVTNTVPFAIVPVNLNWDFSGTYFTQVNIGSTNVTNSSNHLLALTNNPLPVELTSFTGKAVNENVELKWATSTELINYGFNVERKSKDNSWTKIGFVIGSGVSNSGKDYSFVDRKVVNGEYSYRLKQVDNDGSYKYSDEIEVRVNNIPREYRLDQNYPNPFNPSTNIKYAIPYDGRVVLTVYNILGDAVRVLYNEFRQAGYYEEQFNAQDLSSGTYLYSISVKSADGIHSYNSVKKMILMK